MDGIALYDALISECSQPLVGRPRVVAGHGQRSRYVFQSFVKGIGEKCRLGIGIEIQLCFFSVGYAIRELNDVVNGTIVVGL